MPAARLDTAVDALAESGEPIFQALRPVDYGEGVLDDEDMARTIYSMGTSLMTWVQRIHAAGLFAADARVLGLTSEGNARRVARLRGGGGGQGRRSNRCRARSRWSSPRTASARTSSSPA